MNSVNFNPSYRRIIELLSLPLIVLVSCNINPPDAVTTYSSGNTIAVNLDSTSEPSFFEFFSGVEIIPLETNPSSVIKDVSKVIICSERCYIMDSDQGLLFIFDLNGKYLCKINRKGSGPGEYSLLYDFHINTNNGNIELLDGRGKIIILSSELEYLTSVSLPVRAVHNFIRLNNDTLVLYSNSGEKKIYFYSLKDECIISSDFQSVPLADFMPRSNMSSLIQTPDRTVFFVPYSNSIFDLSKGTVERYLEWDFGKYNFSLDELEQDLSEYEIPKQLLKLRNKAWSFYYFRENESYFLTRFVLNNAWIHLWYEKNNRRYLVFRKFEEGIFPPVIEVLNSHYALSYCEPDQLTEYLNRIIISTNQQEILNKIRPEDNPVLLIYKFKDLSKID